MTSAIPLVFPLVFFSQTLTTRAHCYLDMGKLIYALHSLRFHSTLTSLLSLNQEP